MKAHRMSDAVSVRVFTEAAKLRENSGEASPRVQQ